jgi:quercetin 2,3-dioxygenase
MKLLTGADFGFAPMNCPHVYRIERHHGRIAGVAAGPGGTFERLMELLGNLGTLTGELDAPQEPLVAEWTRSLAHRRV